MTNFNRQQYIIAHKYSEENLPMMAAGLWTGSGRWNFHQSPKESSAAKIHPWIANPKAASSLFIEKLYFVRLVLVKISRLFQEECWSGLLKLKTMISYYYRLAIMITDTLIWFVDSLNLNPKQHLKESPSCIFCIECRTTSFRRGDEETKGEG